MTNKEISLNDSFTKTRNKGNVIPNSETNSLISRIPAWILAIVKDAPTNKLVLAYWGRYTLSFIPVRGAASTLFAQEGV